MQLVPLIPIAGLAAVLYAIYLTWDVLRRDTGDIQHAAGSCRMTGPDDADGVVNPDGTVKGIAALRVADASVMPLLPAEGLECTCLLRLQG